MPHALVVPASGQGHVNPCMLLARSLAALGFEVSFVYFSSEYANLKAKKRLVEPDLAPTEEGGDLCHQQATARSPSSGGGGADGPYSPLSNGENDNGSIHIHVVQDGFGPGDAGKLFFVTPAMKENLFKLILELREQGKPLTCLVGDLFAPWTIHVAERAGISLTFYWPGTAMAYLHLYDLPRLFSQGVLPEKGSPTQWKRESPLMVDHIPGLPPFSSELYPKDVRFGNASSPMVSLLGQIFSYGKLAERMLIHTLSELEDDAFHALRAVGVNAYAVGPLLHHATKQGSNGGAVSKAQKSDCIQWLDTQPKSSVLYVAFGSLVRISEEDVEELALGLEASGNPFLWVIREDSCAGGTGLTKVLPKGFLDRTSGKGKIISWAPQLEVLAHRAVGGFLTHCGWNSALESLCEGVPMLCCPFFADQPGNAHQLCYVWGVGVELGRTDTGSMDRKKVELGVKSLMYEEEGRKVRENAQKVMEMGRRACQQGGVSHINLQRFFEDMHVRAKYFKATTNVNEGAPSPMPAAVIPSKIGKNFLASQGKALRI